MSTPALAHNVRGRGRHYSHPVDGTVVYYGCRESPDGDEQILFVGNMEGPETTVAPTELHEAIPESGWTVELASPEVDAVDTDSLTLGNGQAVVWIRQTD